VLLLVVAVVVVVVVVVGGLLCVCGRGPGLLRPHRALTAHHRLPSLRRDETT